MDPETGLVYLRARYYDPTTAQFLSRDPAVAETQSAYGYVDNNPLNGGDPSGLDWGWNPLQDVAQAWNDTGGKVVTFISDLCYAGPGSSGGCQSFADQHPALVPVLSAVATVCTLGAAMASNPDEAGSVGGAGSGETGPTVGDVLQSKVGSITRAPLPPGSPSWDDIRDMTMQEVRQRAAANEPGYRTILKLLS